MTHVPTSERQRHRPKAPGPQLVTVEAIGTGALDPETQRCPELGAPPDQRPVSGAIGIENGRAQQSSTLIENSRGMNVLMGVDTDDHST